MIIRQTSIGMNNRNVEKVGVGVITCNRPNLFRECIAGIPEADLVVVVNDGDPYPSTMYPSRTAQIIQHKRNKGVGRSKNDALRFLLRNGCRHIFLCEDDVRVLNPMICQEYVRASRLTGILHFNFAYHGPGNKSPLGEPAPRKIVDYDGAVSIGLNLHSVGAFSYYREDVLRACGLIHPVYKNALDHVDHTYRIVRRGFHPPFWWFADLAESWRYIEDLDPQLKNSTIRINNWSHRSLLRLNNFYFMLRNGSRVLRIPDASEQEVERVLGELKGRYAYSYH